MKRTNRKLVQAAERIHERLFGKTKQSEQVALPFFSWNSIQVLQRQIGKARQRGWHAAARQLNEDLALNVTDFRRLLDEVSRRLQVAHRTPCHKVSIADVYRDLLALSSEFTNLEVDLKAHKVAVTTDTIKLEDVFLGSFEIRLEWNCIGKIQQPYRVIALDPHPAAKSDGITHPHVQDECLCEGEGRLAIAAALAEGRLYDFFLLVSQVLHTYGRGSAYVELDRWQSIPCDDCGEYVARDEHNDCHSCHITLCGECSYACPGCDESFCSGCLAKCSVCGKEYCWSCGSTCLTCGKQYCDDCRKVSGLCCPSFDKQHKEHEHDSTRQLHGEAVATPA